ncbi:MAG: RNA polymerase sigma factor [Brumimicrobium sp.]
MNRKEYNKAVQEHASNLFGYVFKYLRNTEDSHDIVQDVFEKLWKNKRKVELTKAKAWMFRTGHNALINFSNKKQRTMYHTEMIPERGKIDKSFENKEIIDLALSLLPPVQKSIVLLRDFEGYTYDEIGEILEISSSQVKVYLFRARKKMKKQLKDLTLVQ